jgi:hypothetical protein
MEEQEVLNVMSVHVCILALVIQHVHCNFLRRVMLSSVACLAVPYFSHHLVKGTTFRKKIIEHKMCVLIFCRTLPEEFLIVKEFSEILS